MWTCFTSVCSLLLQSLVFKSYKFNRWWDIVNNTSITLFCSCNLSKSSLAAANASSTGRGRLSGIVDGSIDEISVCVVWLDVGTESNLYLIYKIAVNNNN